MSAAINWLKRRKKALNLISRLMENAEHVIAIHYSCESFYDRGKDFSPKIAAIAVRNLANGQTKSFSVHLIAEEQHKSDSIENDYIMFEKIMLDEFYNYAKSHSGVTWLHWNMRNIYYGFEAIAHRYRILGGNPSGLPDDRRVDLSRLLKTIYGSNYIGHPRLTKLVELNKISMFNYLVGFEEAEAFSKHEYLKLNQSTLRKVDIICEIIEKVDMGTLKTQRSLKDDLRIYPQIIGEWIKDNWLASLVFAILAIFGIVLSIIQLLK